MSSEPAAESGSAAECGGRVKLELMVDGWYVSAAESMLLAMCEFRLAAPVETSASSTSDMTPIWSASERVSSASLFPGCIDCCCQLPKCCRWPVIEDLEAAPTVGTVFVRYEFARRYRLFKQYESHVQDYWNNTYELCSRASYARISLKSWVQINYWKMLLANLLRGVGILGWWQNEGSVHCRTKV